MRTKPITSPGRTEKFPPPLMRFLRSNGGSKSTRRTSSSSTRSSPLFIRKKNSATVETTTQEPTSPKVTCMGQVRAKKRSRSKDSSPNKWFCWSWNWKSKKKSLFFCNSSCSSPSKSVFRSWFLCCSSQDKVDETVLEVRRNEEPIDKQEEVEDEDEVEESKGFVSTTAAGSHSPPKNALFLMRCRSDPCKNSSTSMFSRFSDSSTDQNYITNTESSKEIEKPTLENLVTDNEEKIESCETSSSSNGSSSTVIKEVVSVVEKEGGVPLTLTRCKSDPTFTRLMKVDDETENQKKRNSESK
ncbi:uncharacterized protein LOC113320283 [Papaver somniferum]|uniref:uncharacterized protein LOC113320283 n=1 Tax=Papaver somniferum TaxID=3469 RepID=UPI000E6F8D19|nr:uncharacterized protein LOC113320283 [Papaver somniferum]